jgi:hypothetical protein
LSKFIFRRFSLSFDKGPISNVFLTLFRSLQKSNRYGTISTAAVFAFLALSAPFMNINRSFEKNRETEG